MISETVLKSEFEKAVNIFREKLTLDEDLALLKSSLKDEGLESKEVTILMQIASAKAKDDLASLDDKADKIKDFLQRVA